MAPKILMLGWGFPPNVTGGLDTAIAEVFWAFEDRDDFDMELLLPAELAPEDREGIHTVETGSGDIIERVDRMVEEFADLATDADVVHTHDWFGYEPGITAAEATDCPWVTTFHSLTIERNRDPPEIEREAEQRIVDETDHLLTVSHITADRIRDQYGGEARVVHNGMPSVDATGRDLKVELGIDGRMLFFVGRHTHQKGIEYLIGALDRMSRTDVTAVIGGSGHLTDQLRRLAELLDVEDQVRFVGYVEEAELPDYYASADLFVSPSVAEPFGITVVEALSVGTRVVTTECGAAEVLPDDCLVRVEPDSRSVARGIQEGLAIDDPVEYDLRTWDQVAGEHADFYREII